MTLPKIFKEEDSLMLWALAGMLLAAIPLLGAVFCAHLLLRKRTPNA